MNDKLKRIPMGIPGFDQMVEGGLRENSINLIAGGAGTGKTILAMQFIINGITKYNEPGLYITFEERKHKVYADMSRFGWDLAKHEKQGKLVFLEYTPEQVKRMLTEGGGVIENVIEKSGIKRIVIESISSFSLLYEDELTKKGAALTLFSLIGKWNCTGLMTSQMTFKDDTDSGILSAALEFEVDGIIVLYHIKRKGIRKRALEILKMRCTKIPEKTVSMEIADKGIHINPDSIVVF